MNNILKKLILPLAALAGTALCAFAADAPAAETPKKKTVAVAKIQMMPTLKAKIERERRSEAMNRILESISDNMGAAVHGTRRLEVVTVDDLDVIVKAIERGENVLAEKSLAPSLKLFDYAFAIKIDDYQDFEQKKEFATLGQTVTFRNIRIGVIANFIDSATGSVAEAPNFVVSKSIKVNNSSSVKSTGGDKTDEIIAQLTRELCKKIAFKLADTISPPRVLSVGKSGTVTINKGEDTDIYVGQIYEIFAVGEEMIDPDTGESLGCEEECVGKVKVTRVNAKVSQAKILENNGIEKLAVARPLVQEKDGKK